MWVGYKIQRKRIKCHGSTKNCQSAHSALPVPISKRALLLQTISRWPQPRTWLPLGLSKLVPRMVDNNFGISEFSPIQGNRSQIMAIVRLSLDAFDMHIVRIDTPDRYTAAVKEAGLEHLTGHVYIDEEKKLYYQVGFFAPIGVLKPTMERTFANRDRFSSFIQIADPIAVEEAWIRPLVYRAANREEPIRRQTFGTILEIVLTRDDPVEGLDWYKPFSRGAGTTGSSITAFTSTGKAQSLSELLQPKTD